MAIKLRLGLVALTAMLCRLNALGATTGCRVVEDDRSTTVQAQDGGLSSTFTVKRIVGPGTSSEIDSLGKLLNPDPYLLGASPVLSRNGCITFSGRIKLDPQYYYFVKSQYQFKGTILPIAFSFGTGVPLGGVALPLNFRDGLIYQGAFPVNLPVTIRAKLNGQPVFEDLVSVPIQEAGVEYPVTRSIPLDETRIRNLRFATQRDRLNDIRGGYFCESVPQTEENCPGLNILEFSYSAPESFEVLGIGTSAPGVIAKVSGKLLNFSAMAPVVLATGCCGEQPKFYDNANALGFTLAQSFRDAKLPFYLPVGGPLSLSLRGSIEEGGAQLGDRMSQYSKIFGTKWLHVVAHSKGGLNSRFVLGRRIAENQGLGVRSVVTLNTPHTGSVAGDLVRAILNRSVPDYRQGFGQNNFLALIALKQIADDATLLTQGDLNQRRLAAFNQDPAFASPPKTTRVGSVSRQIAVRTTISDANADGGQENQDVMDTGGNVISYAWRDISTFEARAFAPLLTAKATTSLYNFVGKHILVSIVASPPTSFRVTFALPVQSPRRFLFNDGIVTVESQSYGSSATIPPLSPFFAPSMIQRDLPRPAPVGANHNAVSNGIVGGQLVIFYKAGLP